MKKKCFWCYCKIVHIGLVLDEYFIFTDMAFAVIFSFVLQMTEGMFDGSVLDFVMGVDWFVRFIFFNIIAYSFKYFMWFILQKKSTYLGSLGLWSYLVVNCVIVIQIVPRSWWLFIVTSWPCLLEWVVPSVSMLQHFNNPILPDQELPFSPPPKKKKTPSLEICPYLCGSNLLPVADEHS